MATFRGSTRDPGLSPRDDLHQLEGVAGRDRCGLVRVPVDDASIPFDDRGSGDQADLIEEAENGVSPHDFLHFRASLRQAKKKKETQLW